MAAVIIIAKHGSNIQRLLRGVENRLGSKTASGPE
jgi:glycerol-3-phosphate acyltransferase PlsY